MEVVGRADYRHVPPRQEYFRQISVGCLMNSILPWKAPETGACHSWSGLNAFFSAWWLWLSAFLSLARTSLRCGEGQAPRRLGLWAPVLPSQQCWILLIVLCCWFISRWELFAVLHSFPNLLIHKILFTLLKSSLFWFCWASFMPPSNESFLIDPILTKLANF